MPVIDTSFLVALQRKDPWAIQVAKRFDQDGEVVFVPAAAWFEYMVGFGARGRATSRRKLHRSLAFVPFDEPIAEEAIGLQTHLLRDGRRLAWHDAQIAATALHLGEPLCAIDGDFKQVPGLEVIGP